MRHQAIVPQELLSTASDMLAEGMSWSRIERSVGLSTDVLRRRLDPEWAEVRAKKVRNNRARIRGEMAGGDRARISPADAARALATVPPDTRSSLSKMMGDPLPGRSALDRRQL